MSEPTDLLLNVPPETPHWRRLQRDHLITVMTRKDGTFAACCEVQADDPLEDYLARATGYTEREAVVRLIHQERLPGWKEVSV